MPKKIRQLISELKRARFVNEGGKGSHRNFVHPSGVWVVISGNPGDDAHQYQEKQVRERINEAQLREEKQ
jgi:predicted RNA binding protein YcfA (HicA-like mRNA interferase family)